ncbi:Cytochrome P450 2L1 [Armadillidium nasatum]|uniref:Cytochrome P450 2L1 n=1 Tax=Armadillidium nasatum TaxID=96803 RepID=A0A5N5SIK4_9CRUS|nr:Cytochrome P450 2L1 [Armadillidium nasatum]
MLIEIALLGLLIYIVWNAVKKPSDYPPGPLGITNFGHIFFRLSEINLRLEELKKKHGNIISWKIGTRLFVFLCDPKQIKEAFQSQDFADRPDLMMFSLFEGKPKLGIVASNGIHWNNSRRFTLRHLKDLGMGKSKIVSAVQYEASELVKEIKKQAGTPAPLPQALKPAIINVLWQMVASIRHDLDNEEVVLIDKLIQKVMENASLIMMQDFFPWPKNILPESIYNWLVKKHILIEAVSALESSLRKVVNEHIKSLDESNPRDYIDEYLIEMKKQIDNPESTMSIRDLITSIADLFDAGLQTTTATIYWAVFYLASFPEVQKKLHAEIDKEIPKGNLVNADDKKRLPYTEAFLNEVLRFSSLIPLGVFRSVSKDIKFGGYTIPKDAIVGMLAGSIHFDPKYFEFPNEFRPERFINAEGKFESPKEFLMAFGLGKRQCLGEALARMELFIFLTTMLQELQFSVPPNQTIDLKPNPFPAFNPPKFDQNILVTVRK